MRIRTFLLNVAALVCAACASGPKPDQTYVVLASETVHQDSEWNAVAEKLQAKHSAKLFYFNRQPREALDQVRNLSPRYVAIVEKPENINDKYVIDLAKMSREIDDDIYADYLWGIITGYTAESASRMLDNSTEPLIIHNCVSDIAELNSGKWFDNHAWVDDHVKGQAGEKKGFDSEVKVYQFNFDDELKVFSDFFKPYAPDLFVTATHANFNNLTVPFMPANQSKFVSYEGKVYKEYNLQRGEEVSFAGNRNVYFAVGNCLIGGINNDPNSMPPAWINHANSATMIGYVVTTWYGRNGWGGLKYWITNPGRYTLSQSIYLNQQDMMAQMNRWDPAFDTIDFPFTLTEEQLARVNESRKQMEEFLKKHKREELRTLPPDQRPRVLSDNALAMETIETLPSIDKANMDMVGFLYDRDVLAYYGDPLWDVRIQELKGETDFKVQQRCRKGICTLTITTDKDFSLERMQGGHFKEEHVLDLPFSYFLPARLKNARLVEGQDWDAVVDENFVLVYNPGFEPGKTYTIKIAYDQ